MEAKKKLTESLRKLIQQEIKNVLKGTEELSEGPEELGAYRRLVITSDKIKEIKKAFAEFMSRADIKSQYPDVKITMVDSKVKPNTIVVDVNGDKATVIQIKLSDVLKRTDSKAISVVRKEKKLK
jgi:hypothetical protein